MKSQTVSRIPLLAAAAIIAAGSFVAGRLSSPAAADADSRTDAALPAKSDRSPSTLGPGSPNRPDRPGSASDRHGSSSRFSDPVERMRGALISGDPLDQTRAWLDFVDRLGADQFESVVATFRSDGVDEDEIDRYAMLLAGWAKMNPFAAIDYAKKNTSSRFARQTILATWARSDPDAAIFWAESNHEGDGANPWMVGVVRGLAADDPMRAGVLMASLPYSGERGQALKAVMPGILKQGPEAAREWIANISDDRFREVAMARAANALAKVDPRGTADWLLSNPGDAANRNFDDVMGTWANQDEAAAISYFDKLPQGEARSNALCGIVKSMVMEDPREASTFLDSHAADADDRVYQQFAWQSSRNDPEIAADTVGRIDNERDRNATYSRILDGWVRRDQQAAVEWINRTPGIPDSVIERINRHIDQMEQRQQ